MYYTHDVLIRNKVWRIYCTEWLMFLYTQLKVTDVDTFKRNINNHIKPEEPNFCTPHSLSFNHFRLWSPDLTFHIFDFYTYCHSSGNTGVDGRDTTKNVKQFIFIQRWRQVNEEWHGLEPAGRCTLSNKQARTLGKQGKKDAGKSCPKICRMQSDKMATH